MTYLLTNPRNKGVFSCRTSFKHNATEGSIESGGRCTIRIIGIWENYCTTVRNHLPSWDQFFVHVLLCSNATVHTLHLFLPSTSLRFIEVTLIDSPVTQLFCAALSWELARNRQLTTTFLGVSPVRKFLVCFSNIPDVVSDARRPDDAIPLRLYPATVQCVAVKFSLTGAAAVIVRGGETNYCEV
jgi:hypothetical protein